MQFFVLFYKQSCEYLIFGGLGPGFFPEDQKNKVALYVGALVHPGRNWITPGKSVSKLASSHSEKSKDSSEIPSICLHQ